MECSREGTYNISMHWSNIYLVPFFLLSIIISRMTLHAAEGVLFRLFSICIVELLCKSPSTPFLLFPPYFFCSSNLPFHWPLSLCILLFSILSWLNAIYRNEVVILIWLKYSDDSNCSVTSLETLSSTCSSLPLHISKREYLLVQIRHKDQIIRSLVTTLQEW